MKIPSASRQIAFHQLLVGARRKWLMAALTPALAQIDPVLLKKELSDFVPKDAQRVLASAGIRDEHIFPTPLILRASPSLVGYYRLLLGAPRKSFYASGSGLGRFKAIQSEEEGLSRFLDDHREEGTRHEYHPFWFAHDHELV